jgi:hypothetical protein
MRIRVEVFLCFYSWREEMAQTTGFQQNATISSAFWIYRPDPVVNQIDREILVAVNGIQYLEATPAQIVVNSFTSIGISNNLLTIIGSFSGVQPGMNIYFTGLTNAAFLNGEVVIVNSVSGNQFTANFTGVNYGPTSEPSGAQGVNAGVRTVWLYYAESNVSPSQAPRRLDGVVATLFIYDMEGLFNMPSSSFVFYVNSTQVATPNLNATVPAAPAGSFANIIWQFDNNGNVSAYYAVTEGGTIHITTQTSSYVAFIYDSVILMNSSLPTTVTLPVSGTTAGQVFRIKNLNTGVVTVTGVSGTIDGASSVALSTQYESADIVFDGTNFWLL